MLKKEKNPGMTHAPVITGIGRQRQEDPRGSGPSSGQVWAPQETLSHKAKWRAAEGRHPHRPLTSTLVMPLTPGGKVQGREQDPCSPWFSSGTQRTRMCLGSKTWPRSCTCEVEKMCVEKERNALEQEPGGGLIIPHCLPGYFLPSSF